MTSNQSWVVYNSEKGIFEEIIKGETDFESQPWPSISDSAKDLVRKLLNKDPKKRILASQALEKGVSKKLQEKDHEINEMNKKKNELMDRIKQMAIEAQNWHYRAKYNESVVNVLKANLQQAMSQNNNVIAAADQEHPWTREGEALNKPIDSVVLSQMMGE